MMRPVQSPLLPPTTDVVPILALAVSLKKIPDYSWWFGLTLKASEHMWNESSVKYTIEKTTYILDLQNGAWLVIVSRSSEWASASSENGCLWKWNLISKKLNALTATHWQPETKLWKSLSLSLSLSFIFISLFHLILSFYLPLFNSLNPFTFLYLSFFLSFFLSYFLSL